jgi:hypothetical protein
MKDLQPWTEVAANPEELRETLTSPVIELPSEFGANANSLGGFLDLLNEYAASIGLADQSFRFTLPPRFRHERSDSADAGGGLAVGMMAAARSDVCESCASNRRRLLAKLLGIGGVAALLTAFGPLGKKVLATHCGDCGYCQVHYCYGGNRYSEFYFCKNAPSIGYCNTFCTSYVQRCTFYCGCF